MTDTQILTITIAIVFPVLGFVGTIAALVINNRRMDDFREEIKSTIKIGFEHMEMLLKLHEAEHHRR